MSGALATGPSDYITVKTLVGEVGVQTAVGVGQVTYVESKALTNSIFSRN